MRAAKNRQRTADGKKSPAQCGRQHSRASRTNCSPLTPPNFAFMSPIAFRLYAAQFRLFAAHRISPFRSPTYFSP
jgi:hypothetical protein